MFARFSSTASTIATRAASTPFTMRRGLGAVVLIVSACTSTGSARRPFERDRDARSRLGAAVAEEQRAGVGDLGDARRRSCRSIRPRRSARSGS